MPYRVTVGLQWENRYKIVVDSGYHWFHRVSVDQCQKKKEKEKPRKQATFYC